MQSSVAASQAVRNEITATTQKLQRLHRLYLDEDIERETYLAEKEDLLSRRKSLEGKITGLGNGYCRLARTATGLDKRRIITW